MCHLVRQIVGPFFLQIPYVDIQLLSELTNNGGRLPTYRPTGGYSHYTPSEQDFYLYVINFISYAVNSEAVKMKRIISLLLR